MVKEINAQRSAYDKIEHLNSIHDTIYQELTEELEKTRGLLGGSNGLQIEHTNRKIEALLNAMERQILPNLRKSFAETEQGVAQMEHVLTENDRF